MKSIRFHLGALALGAALAVAAASAVSAGVPRPAFVAQQTSSIQGIGDYTSMRLDAMGRAHVAYFDRSREALVYAVQVQDGWRTELVDADGVVGWYASMQLDGQGNPRIAYYDATRGHLKYASRERGAWATSVVDQSNVGVGHYCSLALDANGQPGISYYDSQNLCLRMASLTSQGWSIETIDGGLNGAEYEQAIDRADRTSKTPALSQDVPNVGHYSSLHIDRRGIARVSYLDITNGDLKFAARVNGQWALETVDAVGEVGEYSSLQVSPMGRAFISYYDLQNGDLKLAVSGANGRWTITTVDSKGEVGAYSSLMLNGNGQPCISYLDATHQTLKFAQRAEGVWMVETVDEEGATGRNTSLALDRDGEPVIAYTASNGKGSFRMVSSSVQFGGRPVAGDTQEAPVRALAAWPMPYKGGALNVSFVIPARGGSAEVRMIDLAGRHIRTLQRGSFAAGRQTLTWDGRDDSGRDVASGVYFLVTRSGGQESKLKLVVTR